MKLTNRWKTIVAVALAAAFFVPGGAEAARFSKKGFETKTLDKGSLSGKSSGSKKGSFSGKGSGRSSSKTKTGLLPVPIENPSIRNFIPKPAPAPKGPRDVIVQLDASKIDKRATQMRKRRRLRHDDKRIRSYKRGQFKALAGSLKAKLGKRGLVVVESYRNFPLVRIAIDGNADVKWLESLPGVRSVFEDQINEPHLADSLLQIGQPVTAAAGHTGARRSIAILDTGAQAGNRALNGRIRFAGTFHDEDDGDADTREHGTNVAAIAAAVAPDAGILSLDVFEDIDGENLSRSTSQIRAIDFVIDTRDVFNTVSINMSLGSAPDGECDTPMEEVFRQAAAAGIATIVSSGNDSSLNAIGTPACAPTAISVGAVNEIDGVAGFSNSGDDLDLLAPGERVVAAGILMSGTSQAAPHVAGAWAVVSAARPTLDVDGILDLLQATGTVLVDGRQGRETPRLQLNAALGLTVQQILEPIIITIGCNLQVVTDAALCGTELVLDTVTDAAQCGMDTVTSAALCGVTTVTSAVQCGVERITSAAQCGWDTLTFGLFDDRDGLICSCSNWSCSCEVPATCTQPATCNIAGTCNVPATCDALRPCDPNVEECEALTCEVELCGF